MPWSLGSSLCLLLLLYFSFPSPGVTVHSFWHAHSAARWDLTVCLCPCNTAKLGHTFSTPCTVKFSDTGWLCWKVGRVEDLAEKGILFSEGRSFATSQSVPEAFALRSLGRWWLSPSLLLTLGAHSTVTGTWNPRSPEHLPSFSLCSSCLCKLHLILLGSDSS
jgi:hypothetical protein